MSMNLQEVEESIEEINSENVLLAIEADDLRTKFSDITQSMTMDEERRLVARRQKILEKITQNQALRLELYKRQFKLQAIAELEYAAYMEGLENGGI